MATATVNSLTQLPHRKTNPRRVAPFGAALAVAFLATVFVPLAGAYHNAPDCCDPLVRLTGVEEPLPDYPGLYDFPVLGPAYYEARDTVNLNYRYLRDSAYRTSESLIAPGSFVNPLPHYTTQYHGSVVVDVVFPADCECEVTEAWITAREIADGAWDPIVPVLVKHDADTWSVHAGDWDTYEITFHATYECENAPGGTITTSWIQFN